MKIIDFKRVCCFILNNTKNNSFYFLKVFIKLIKTIFIITVFSSFFIIPFLQKFINHTLAQLIWYPSFFIFLCLLVVDLKKEEKTFQSPLYDFLSKWGFINIIPIMLSILVFNYYNIHRIWLWVIFFYFLIYVPLFFFAFHIFRTKGISKSDKFYTCSSLLCLKGIILYWLLDLFYLSVFNRWLLFTFIFGTLSVLIIFMNVISVFVNSADSVKPLIVVDFLFGIVVTVYLLYIIPNSNLQNIILTMTSALFGGLFTLMSVAWTIRDGEKKRQENLLRIESERKEEEERKKYIPYLRISNEAAILSVCCTALELLSNDFLNSINATSYVNLKIKNVNIKNISNFNIILKGVLINNKYYGFDHEIILEPSTCCVLKFDGGIESSFDKLSSFIVAGDILGNVYKIECEISRCAEPLFAIKDPQGNRTRYDSYYKFINFKLPFLLENDEIFLNT